MKAKRIVFPGQLDLLLHRVIFKCSLLAPAVFSVPYVKLFVSSDSSTRRGILPGLPFHPGKPRPGRLSGSSTKIYFTCFAGHLSPPRILSSPPRSRSYADTPQTQTHCLSISFSWRSFDKSIARAYPDEPVVAESQALCKPHPRVSNTLN